jgi:hypothetical protein
MEILLKITNAALCDKNKLLHVNFRIRYIISPGDKVLRADNTSDMKNVNDNFIIYTRTYSAYIITSIRVVLKIPT